MAHKDRGAERKMWYSDDRSKLIIGRSFKKMKGKKQMEGTCDKKSVKGVTWMR